jgi:hypothetical protein
MKTKKELKEEYKKIVHPKGVSKIVNKINGKIFVVGSPNLNAIWNSQKIQLKTGTHQNEELQKDWNELGEDNFYYEIIDTLNLKDFDANKDYSSDINEFLEMYLDELQPYDEKGYNKRKLIYKK